jgi:hypothetical protein
MIMLYPDYRRRQVDDHVEELRRDAARPVRRTTATRAVDTTAVELRLCTVHDDFELAMLAELNSRPLPFGRLVVARVHGRLVAALPIGGGLPLTDPFVRTDHILPLLELRAAQLRDPEPRRRLVPRYVSLIRGSIQA